jgi:hypothetical protein
MNTPSKEQILEAAKTSPEARKALIELFPEIFQEKKYFDLSKLPKPLFSNEDARSAGFYDKNFLQVRKYDTYANKAFYLSNHYNWELVEDETGMLCLIPTKKEKNKK